MSAVALSLRCFTESVMDPYYVWPALALAVIVAGTSDAGRLAIVAVLGVAVTVGVQYGMPWLPWWLFAVGGMTATLILARPLTQRRREPMDASRAEPAISREREFAATARPSPPVRPRSNAAVKRKGSKRGRGTSSQRRRTGR
jgi:hypothetical protein